MGSLQDLAQFLFAGLTGGAIYALIALGFGVVHNVLGIVNFAQVDFVSLGGMLAYTVLRGFGFPPWAALAAAVVGTAAVAVAVERLAIRPSRSQSQMVLIFLTVGASVTLRGAMKLLWGKSPLALPPLAGDEPLSVLGATVMPQTLWIVALTALTMVGLAWFFRRTPAGLAMRGVADNADAAAVVGLPVGWIRALTFGVAGGLGGLAGVLVAPITALSYDVGVLLGLKGFSAAILGGFGSFAGAIVGGLTLGLLESLSAGYVSSAYKDVLAFAVLLLVLFVRPQGLLGRASAS